jgi:hypothetical protein
MCGLSRETRCSIRANVYVECEWLLYHRIDERDAQSIDSFAIIISSETG